MKLDILSLAGKLLLWGLLLTPPAQAADACLTDTAQNPDQARALAAARLRRDPQDQTALLCAATAAFHAGDFRAAGTQFQQLAARAADPAQAALLHSKSGWAFMRAQDSAAAGKAFAAAVKLNPKEAQYWQDHATALMQTEQFWDARRELDYALTLAPRAPALWALRADCWLKLGMIARARQDARAALALDDKQPLAIAVLQKAVLLTEE